MQRRRSVTIGVPLGINFMLSWAILPFGLPPFRGYSLRQLFEVLLWQGIGTVGWPAAIPGALFSLPVSLGAPRVGSLLLTLMYPAMLVLLVRSVRAKTFRRWELVALHVLLTFSFTAVWYRVLNGYDFMAG